MAYQNYSQRDGRWAGQRLGTQNGITIGSDGCYVTAFANVAEHFGHDVTPAQLDDIFTERHLYYNSNGTHNDPACLCYDQMLQDVYPEIKYQWSRSFAGPADLSLLTNSYEEEYILMIDADNNPANGVNTHFMRYYDNYNGVVRVIDSWTGQLVSIADVYGNPATVIYKIVKYVGPSLPKKADPIPEPPVAAPEEPVVPAQPHMEPPVIIDTPEPVEEPETPVEVPTPEPTTNQPGETPVAKPTKNPIVEAVKEIARLAVFAVISYLIASVSGLPQNETTGALLVLLRAADKYVHTSDKIKLGGLLFF